MKEIRMDYKTYEDEKIRTFNDGQAVGFENAWENLARFIASGQTVEEFLGHLPCFTSDWGRVAISLGQETMDEEDELTTPNKEKTNGN